MPKKELVKKELVRDKKDIPADPEKVTEIIDKTKELLNNMGLNPGCRICKNGRKKLYYQSFW